jgi:hypothetical protein
MKTLLLFVVLFNFTLCFAQKSIIQGVVKDKKSGEAIIDANVFLLDENVRCISDNFGVFSLHASKSETYQLVLSKIGYFTDTIQLHTSNTTNLSIELIPATREIKDIIIKSNTSNKTGASLVEIPISKIKTLPQLGGEVDVLKSYQLMPGIQGGSEGSSGLYIRGGSPDQNLILIDDVPVYNASHLGGFLSILDVNAVNKVSIIKGGFPARYGGRLSSVIDVRMKEGNANGLHYSYNIGLLSSKIFAEGRMNKKTKFMISARRFNLDIPMRILVKQQNKGEVVGGYTFYDLYAKITHEINEKNKLSLFVYNGRDNVFLRQNFLVERENELFKFKGNTKWGNTLLGLKLIQNISSKLNGNATVSFSKYAYSTGLNSQVIDNTTKNETVSLNENFKSSIFDVSAKYDATYNYSSQMKIRSGIAFVTKFANPSEKILNFRNEQFQFDTLEQERKIVTQEFNCYAESEHELSSKVIVNYGLHLMNFLSNGKIITSLQPRLLLTYTENENLNFNVGYSKMTQNIHLLTNNNAGLPTDMWVPATKNTPPSNCHQISLSSNYRFHHNQYQISADIYYKRFSNLIEFKEGLNFTNFRNDWENKIEKNGVGNAGGLELMIEKREGRLTGWIGYTLAFNYRKFNNINDNKYFPFKYDRRHSLTIVGNYNLKKNIIFSCSFVANTGQAITLPVGSYPTPLVPFVPNNINYQPPLQADTLLYTHHNGITYIYKGRNSSRMPLYHRLDLSLTFHKELRKGSRDWVISCYNAYNKQNPFFYYFDADKEKNLHLYQLTLFPIIPSISYNRRF